MKRGTGRTTRMLKHAIELDRAGKAVYVIAANKNNAMLLLTMLATMMPNEIVHHASMNAGNIKIETPESPGNFDWDTLSLRGANRNCVVLVDHFAIEQRFGKILDMWTAYDNDVS